MHLKPAEITDDVASIAAFSHVVECVYDGIGTPAAALAALFNLTAAEMRTLEQLLAGDTPAQAADKLGIQITTLRTHQAHIFDKTGTSRLTDLIRLAGKFSPPISQR